MGGGLGVSFRVESRSGMQDIWLLDRNGGSTLPRDFYGDKNVLQW